MSCSHNCSASPSASNLSSTPASNSVRTGAASTAHTNADHTNIVQTLVKRRPRLMRSVAQSAARSSRRAVQTECSEIRSQWTCEEERRRRRLADVMQVRLLDAITA